MSTYKNKYTRYSMRQKNVTNDDAEPEAIQGSEVIQVEKWSSETVVQNNAYVDHQARVASGM